MRSKTHGSWTRQSATLALGWIAAGCLGMVAWCGTAQAATVTDDFNDNVLDTVKWQSSLPPGATVTETNQELQLKDGGSLVTQQNFDPNSTTSVVVTGRLRINTLSDRLFFYTHGGSLLVDASGERHYGMRWFITGFNAVNVSLDSVVLRGQTSGSLGTATSSSDLAGIVAGSTWLEFRWETTQTQSTFELYVAAGDTSGAHGSLSASVPINGPLLFSHATRYVILQNNNNGVTLALDDITIDQTPPPPAGTVVSIR